MIQQRKYYFSQKSEIIDCAGVQLVVYYFKDMANDQIRMAYKYWQTSEDYEYLAALCAEAKLRGIELNEKIKR